MCIVLLYFWFYSLLSLFFQYLFVDDHFHHLLFMATTFLNLSKTGHLLTNTNAMFWACTCLHLPPKQTTTGILFGIATLSKSSSKLYPSFLSPFTVFFFFLSLLFFVLLSCLSIYNTRFLVCMPWATTRPRRKRRRFSYKSQGRGPRPPHPLRPPVNPAFFYLYFDLESGVNKTATIAFAFAIHTSKVTKHTSYGWYIRQK